MNSGFPSPQASIAPSDEAQDNLEPRLNGSIPVPEKDGSNESDESAVLQLLAKITPAQARSSALAAAPGTVGKVSLEDENGFAVYSVQVDNSDVKVDAGTGTVLHVDSGDAREADSQDEDVSGSEGDEAKDARAAPETAAR